MGNFCRKSEMQAKDRLGKLVKVGLLKELYRQHHITQAQFERLMQLQRA